ncbi:MAG TPA: DUF362 domain-containing protein [Terriglobia bacterium]|nr:DUF362 domain-containing protein [Terriglobia bacterium]
MNKTYPVVTRRDFVRGTVATVLSSGIADKLHARGSARPTRSSTVILVRDEKAFATGTKVDASVLKQMLAELLMRATGQKSERTAWLSLVQLSDVIGVVPTPHLNATHKELIDAVKASLVNAGIPAPQIRNAQGGPDQPRACNSLIALPALKAHWLTGIGTVLKNYITFSGSPSSYHDADNAKLGEIWKMPHVQGKTRLVLVDALRPLCDKGPQPDPRYLWNYSGLIAGTDPVAVEAVCLKIITEKRKALRGEPWPLSPPPLCVSMADEKYGLGTSRLSEIKIERVGWMQDVLV